ncbi:MAG: flagellar biosynthetic protein FliO [Deltaproteobacteria bacterium]|jgi:flagellar protein FliO/FliZ|nr:flagellar biosynthetic protein FliO [Deltaproteobacteria bacterium]
MNAQAAEQVAGQIASQTAGQVVEQVAGQAASIPVFSWSGYITTVGMLCLLLGALWLALRLLKKRGGLKIFGVNEALAVESRLSLGPKKNLLVVRTSGKRLLLGVTDHHISKLAELPLEDDDAADN